MEKPLLQLNQVTMRFGGLTALRNLSLEIYSGELVGLIGPNGAGKTTVFNLITGIYQPIEGSLYFRGHSLANLKPHQITQLGIARTFQNIRLFRGLTVLENVRIGAFVRHQTRLWQAALRTHEVQEEDAALETYAQHWLDVLQLKEFAHVRASALPYGVQRRVEIARALATRPRLILLDEPAAGMNPQESEELMHLIRRLRDEFQVTILLIEHDMRVVMGICERLFVLDHGELIAKGSPHEIRNNPRVIAAYLGEPE